MPEQLRPGDWVQVTEVPPNVEVPTGRVSPHSTYAVIERMRRASWAREVHAVQENGLLELMSYVRDAKRGRVYHWVLLEPQFVKLVRRGRRDAQRPE